MLAGGPTEELAGRLAGGLAGGPTEELAGRLAGGLAGGPTEELAGRLAGGLTGGPTEELAGGLAGGLTGSSAAHAASAAVIRSATRASRAAATDVATPAGAAQAVRATASAAPDAVPGPPAGWSTVVSDDFNGASGGGPSSSWMYDTGPGSSFGTGEIETMTNSSSNVHLDGNGNLDITALNNGGSWTSGRIQTTSANVGAPAGGELEVTASIEQPNPG